MYRSDNLKGLRSKMFVIAIVFFSFLGTALAAPDTSSQGPVSSDNLKVYAHPSSTSRTVTILTKGVHVKILVEVEALGIEWCHIQLLGENEPLGYVNCSGIQRPTSQVSKAGQKNPVSIATPNPAVNDPISLERRPEQHSTPTTVATITPIMPTSSAPTSALSNSDIVSMTKVGLPSDVLVAKIKSSISKFDTSPAALSQLKTSGVADGVILAMVQAPGGASAPPVVQAAVIGPTTTPPSAAPALFAGTSSDTECVILKRMGPADQVTSHMYSFGIRGKQFQYVEGKFPAGATFHGRLTDNDVRNVQKKGGRVVIMEPKYSADDLREAKQSCKNP